MDVPQGLDRMFHYQREWKLLGEPNLFVEEAKLESHSSLSFTCQMFFFVTRELKVLKV